MDWPAPVPDGAARDPVISGLRARIPPVFVTVRSTTCHPAWSRKTPTRSSQQPHLQYRDHDSYAGFSNYFRYTLLLERGGWWVDTDLICLRPFDFDDEYVFSSQLAPPGDGGGEQVNVGAIKAPAGSPVIQYALRRCLEQILARSAGAKPDRRCSPTRSGSVD